MMATAGTLTRQLDGLRELLGTSGWRVEQQTRVEDGRVLPLWVARHRNYPDQQSNEPTELVRRCHWQEDHRR